MAPLRSQDSRQASTGVVTLVVPETYAGAPITKIRYSAFQNDTALSALAFAPGSHVAEIENDAFKGSGLVSVSFPASMRVIGYQSFLGCSSLEEAQIQEGVVEIGYGAFSQCSSLTRMDIPGTVETIKDYAFMNCTGVTEVSFGNPFSATLSASWATNWTFKETDGTTTVDKSVASNLAGHTFAGTASALVMQS